MTMVAVKLVHVQMMVTVIRNVLQKPSVLMVLFVLMDTATSHASQSMIVCTIRPAVAVLLVSWTTPSFLKFVRT